MKHSLRSLVLCLFSLHSAIAGPPSLKSLSIDSIVSQLQKEHGLFYQKTFNETPRHLVVDILKKLDSKLFGLSPESRDRLLVKFLAGPVIADKTAERKAFTDLSVKILPEVNDFLKRLHPREDKTKPDLDRIYVDQVGNSYLSDLIPAVLSYGFMEDGKIRFRLVNTLLRENVLLPKNYQKMKLILAMALFEENDDRLDALVKEWSIIFPKIHSQKNREEILKYIFDFPPDYPSFKESKAYSKFLDATLSSPTIQPALKIIAKKTKKPIKIAHFEDIPVVLKTHSEMSDSCYAPFKVSYQRDMENILDEIQKAVISEDLRSDLTRYVKKVGKKAIRAGDAQQEEWHRRDEEEKKRRADPNYKAPPESEDPMDYTCVVQ